MLIACVLFGAAACRKVKRPSDAPPDQPGNAGVDPGRGGTSVLIVPAKPALPAGWQEFKHPDGAYSLFVPAKPTRSREAAASLRLDQPLQPQESRESIYQTNATPKQPFTCTLQLLLFHPSIRSAFSQFEAKPRQLPAHWSVKSDNAVTWGGLPAAELVVEKSFPGHTPERAYSVMRWCLTADRMYHFLLERTDRMPDDQERSAFFDSFTPGK